MFSFWQGVQDSFKGSSITRPLLIASGGAVIAIGLGVYTAELSLSSARNVSASFPTTATPQASPIGGPATSTIAAASSPQSGPRMAASTNPVAGAPGATANITGTRTVLLSDTAGEPIKPSAAVRAGNSIYCLGPRCLWEVNNAIQQLTQGQTLTGLQLKAPDTIGAVPVQEFCNLVFFPAHNSLMILDKSGDLFEYYPVTGKWQLFRANRPFLAGQPDPQFMDLCVLKDEIALLDPERNQIWKTHGHATVMSGAFKDVLPWRVKPGDAIVSDGASIAFDNDAYVLKHNGLITRYGGVDGYGLARQLPVPFKHLAGMRPSRLLTVPYGPLYIVERENNRVLAVDKQTGQTAQFLFGKDSDLRGLIPERDGFWIIDGDQMVRRSVRKPDSFSKHPQVRGSDQRLDGFIIPVPGMRLPNHPGVFPGARRLYRYGVHEGLDIFGDGSARGHVYMGAPARAADNGKVIRADANFKDMTLAQFSRVMNECLRQHKTSDHNEDLLRGCQVWIDHGGGVVTRYAHLDKINPKLKVNHFANRGDLVGYIGVSGTGQNLPGRTKYPHLHFEIWLDGKYLGYGLTPAETRGVYEDIFGR